MTIPIDIESLDPLFRDVFLNPENGVPDCISKAGCLVLANLGVNSWNAWRAKFPVIQVNSYGAYSNTADFSEHDFRGKVVNFSNYIFGDGARFDSANFGSHAIFSATLFGDGADFFATVFGDAVRFDNAKFGKSANFLGAEFGDGARFNNANFDDHARFAGVNFGIGANFESASFGHEVRFDGTQFADYANFNAAVFGDEARFVACNWSLLCDIYGKRDSTRIPRMKLLASEKELNPNTFNRITFFGAQFLGTVDFSGRQFNGQTSFGKFAGVTSTFFGKAPKFHNCKLNQDTTFDGAIFPVPEGSDEAARAYRTLKLAFSQQHAIRQEQRFFKLEMAEEAAGATGFPKFLYKTYFFCSDYGFSIRRPAILLVVTLLIMMLIYGGLSYLSNCVPNTNSCRLNTVLIEFSLMQSLPLPGLEKLSDTLRGQLFPNQGLISLGVTVAVILHKSISLLALFLIGLAIRNLFKIK